jgi:hypothetical protein
MPGLVKRLERSRERLSEDFDRIDHAMTRGFVNQFFSNLV